jgi:uncharacterized protein YutE (UPF0331/DUF86 family)
MIRQENEIELETLYRVKPRYEKEGFQFLIAPESSELPDFLAGFRPDAIAKRGQERVVIEVKATGRAADRSAIVNFLAGEVPKHEGWRFELIVAEGERDRTSLQAPTKAELQDELYSVEKMIEQGSYKVALPFAWGLLEAISRKLVFDERDQATRFLPRTVVEKLTSEGYLDDETGEKLVEIAHLRNQIVHGFTRLEVRREHLQTLLGVVQQLMNEIEV